MNFQNFIDFSSIIGSIIYGVIRVSLPIGANLDFDAYADIQSQVHGLTKDVFDIMPLLHIAIMTLLYLQLIDIMKVYDFLSKYVKLFYTGLVDSFGFILLFVLLQIYFALAFHVLGATMDDGGNYDTSDDGYDTHHNDYSYISYWSVNILSVIRSSVGDLMPPEYDYWIGRHTDYDEHGLSELYILLIWVTFVMQIFFFIIFFLNYLIAIVSDSYAKVIESEQLAVQDGRHALNEDTLKSFWFNKATRNQDFIVMATELGNTDQESAWEGVVGSVKKVVKKQQKSSAKEFKQIKSSVDEIQSQL